jgi:hypothetical protein
MKGSLMIIALGAIAVCATTAASAEEPLVLEAKIPLGEVAGRIDHMAFDRAGHRLFVAELGNDSIGVVDVRARRTLHTIKGLKRPQGVGYVESSGTLFVANAGDGSVRLFRGADFTPAGRIDLGEDADNIRVDGKSGQVFVGFGSGGIAILDAASGKKRAEIKLRAHPEAFQLAPASDRIYVNVPDARQIAVLDRKSLKQIASWPMHAAGANFPMALADDGARILTVFRHPARLAELSAEDGSTLAQVEVCGDADDVFVDARRHRVYLSCGAGVVDVLERQAGGYRRLASIPTRPGARTSFFSAEIDRLFVAVRAAGATPAAIWVFRPSA